jgi:hypothetical protein
LSENKQTTESALVQLQQLLSKYRFMEANKLPEIEKTLEMAKFLKERKENDAEPFSVQYELHDTLYATARVRAQDTVYLWLGVSGLHESWNFILTHLSIA